MKCKHRRRGKTFRRLDSGHTLEYLQCFSCWIWLPLGPSEETPVVVEVRAAEIADGWPEGEQSDAEDDGWRAHMTGGDPDASPSMLAGWLAREIWLEAAPSESTP